MSLLTYVPSYEDVRALLGVSADELDDTMLGVKVFQLDVERQLNSIHSGLIAAYEAAAPGPSNTADQKRLFKAVQAYCTYFIATRLLATAPHWAPKTISDGKALMQRQAGEPWDRMLAGLQAGAASALAELKTAYNAVASTALTTVTAVRTGLVISSPDVDVVTNA